MELREQVRTERAERARRRASETLLDFTTYTFPKFQVNFHHAVLAKALDEWIETPGDRLIAVLPRRHGKPLAEDSTLILMEDGSRKLLRDVAVGDAVISGAGRPQKVTAVDVQGELSCLNMVTQSGRHIVAALDHPFLTPDGWREASELGPGTALGNVAAPLTVCASTKSDSRWLFPIDRSDEEFRLAGYFVGDGNCTFTGGPQLVRSFQARITTNDDDVAKDIQRCATAMSFKTGPRISDKTSAKTWHVTKGVRPWLRDAALAGKGSHHKTTPPWVFVATHRQVAHYLAAYFACDGTVSIDPRKKGSVCVELYSVNRALLAEAQHLFLRLGIQSTISPKKGRYRGQVHNSWRLRIGGADNIARFRGRVPVCGKKAHKLAGLRLPRIRFDEPILGDPIVSIEHVGLKKCRCIAVENDYTYTANDFIVHNSELCSLRAPAYIFGRVPNARILAASNVASLASGINRKLQKIIDGPRYREVFPDTALWGKNVRTGTWLRNSDEFQIVGREGLYRSVGVGGAIRGYGGDYLIADDLYPDRKAANSPAHRKMVWDWLEDDFLPCAEGDDARVLIIMTRFRVDDVIGATLAKAKANPKLRPWRVIRFPALFEFIDENDRTPGDNRQVGEVLWPEKKSRESWEAERDSSSALHWSGSAQGRPCPADGTIYQQEFFRDWVQYIDDEGQYWAHLPDPITGEIRAKYRFDQVRWFQCCDTALTTGEDSAFTACVTFGLTPAFDLLIYHAWRWRLLVPDIYPALIGLRHGPREGRPVWTDGKWLGSPWPAPVYYQGVETKASGIGVFQLGASKGTPFVELVADRDKIQRSMPVAGMYRTGKVWHLANASWKGMLEDELLVFPSGQFKDVADCVAYGGIQATKDEILRAGFEGDVVYGPSDEELAAIRPVGTVDIGGVMVPVEDDVPWWER